MIARIRPEARSIDILNALAGSFADKESLASGLAEYFGVRKALLTGSARSGLYYLLSVLPQRTIFIPAYTCWVVVEAALLAGKDVRFVDIGLDDYNMNVDLLESAIQPGSLILATHQFGIPCEIDRIRECARRHQCLVIEDNAAAFGSRFRGQLTGSFADCAVVSFEYSKTLTSGSGGAILFQDEELYGRVRAAWDGKLRSGQMSAFKHLAFLLAQNILTHPYLYALTNAVFLKTKGLTRGSPPRELAAGSPGAAYTTDYGAPAARLALLNLKRVQRTIETNQTHASYYLKELAGAGGCALPRFPDYKSPVWMRFPVRILGIPKEDFFRRCLKQGVDLAFTFPYSCAKDRQKFPKAHEAARQVLNLPVYGKLSPKDLERVKDAVLKNLKQEPI